MADKVLLTAFLALGAVLIFGYTMYGGDLATGHVVTEHRVPVCGDGIIDPGETFENCCWDVACPPSFSCMNISYGDEVLVTCGRKLS